MASLELVALALIGCATAGCVLSDVDVSGLPCPCTDGFVCDAATNTCVETSGLAATTTGSGGASTSSDTTTSTGTTTAGTGGGTSGSGGGATTTSTTTGGPGNVTYVASVVACHDPNDLNPGPTACTDEFGSNRVLVDINVAATGGYRYTYLRFDLDGQLAGKTVTGAHVSLYVPMQALSEANQTGEVWQSSPFDLASLATSAPALIGASPIAPDQGAVAQGQTVTFDLPVGQVAPSATTYLAILPTSDDAVFYANLATQNKPTLTVDFQ